MRRPAFLLLALALGLTVWAPRDATADPAAAADPRKAMEAALVRLDQAIKNHDEKAALESLDKIGNLYRPQDDASARGKALKSVGEAVRQTGLPDVRTRALAVIVGTRDGELAWAAIKPSYPKDDLATPTPLDLEVVSSAGLLHAEGAIDSLLTTFKRAKSDELAAAAVRALGRYFSSKQKERVFGEVVRTAKALRPAPDAKTAPDPKALARWDAVKDPIGETLDALTDAHGGTAESWIQKLDDVKGDVRALLPR